MIDIWSSAGLQIDRQLTFKEDVELPMDEVYFFKLCPQAPLSTQRGKRTGIWGQMALLSRIWSEIQDLIKTSVQDHLTPLTTGAQVAAVADKLIAWENSLPPNLKENTDNLERAAALGQGTSFAALHLGFHYYHEVLFYQYMAESHQKPSSLADSYATECTTHARAFCDLLYQCEQMSGCRCVYAMVGHMLVVTSTVYVHMLLFNNEAEGYDYIRSRLGHNFEILTELQKHWDTLDASLTRLKAFHNACLYSIEYSFSMDRWMLRFILQHGTSMSERFLTLSDNDGIFGLSHDRNNVAEYANRTSSLRDWYSQTLS